MKGPEGRIWPAGCSLSMSDLLHAHLYSVPFCHAFGSVINFTIFFLALILLAFADLCPQILYLNLVNTSSIIIVYSCIMYC